MDYRILGPLQVFDGDRPVPLSGPKQRALLAMLLVDANRVVSTDRLIEGLWSGDPPETAATALQVYVSRLRTTLEPERAPGDSGRIILTKAPGYVIQTEAGELDLQRFEDRVGSAEEARRAGDLEQAATLLREALDLWNGPPLADVAYEDFAQPEVARLDELRLVAIEDRLDLELALGRHAHAVGEIEALVADHPLRERLRGLLVLALYRSGRQAEALAAFQDAKRALVDELGIEPSPALARLERSILTQDPALDLDLEPVPPAPAPRPAEEPLPALPPRSHETRKIVTVVFIDIAESTALGEQLDPERLRRVMNRYFETVSEALERHGGTVEKYIGDAVLAVFGIPYLHEDDAVRAIRAAVDVREALVGLNDELERDWGVRIGVRTAVNTGEVVAADGLQGSTFVTGNAVNVASRLEQAAPLGEILLGEETYALVREAVEVEPLGALRLKGVTATANAFRLVALPPGPPRRRRAPAPMVGRSLELSLLDGAFERVEASADCHLFTIIGNAGVGKSRLVAEFVQELPPAALVLRGRCLPYGEGITFWPLAEILGAGAGLSENDSPADAIARIEALLADQPDAAQVAAQLAGAVGLAEGEATAAQTFVATRRLLESLGRERTLVVVFDDLHWAEPTFLDLVEHVGNRVRATSLLVVCMARPELFEARPGWAGGKLNTTSILLEPLTGEECARLVGSLAGEPGVSDETQARIAEAAEGNPLFAEQLVAMVSERDVEPGELAIPPTVQALLASRLDRLPAGERALVECAAIVGKVFEPDEVAALAGTAHLDESIDSLIRKELIRPGRATYPGDEAFRFRHLLIRDAAYDAIPKERRSDLHERYATWLEQSTGERLRELEEIVGYHLEQAFRYRTELGPPGQAEAELAERASARLAAAGSRAFSRLDTPAAVGLLERATGLLPDDAPRRLELLPSLGRALLEAGELTRADDVLTHAIAAADAAGHEGIRWRAVIEREALRFQTDELASPDELVRVANEAIPELERLGDALGLAHAWHLLSDAHWSACRFGASAETLERALAYARRAGDRRAEAEILGGLAAALFFGPTPVPEAVARCDALRDEARGDPGAEPTVLVTLAGLQAMGGRFDTARELYGQGRAILEELGLRLRLAWITYVAASIELLAGDPQAAEREFRDGFEMLREMGEKDALPTQAAGLAEALYELGRYDDALELTVVSEQTAAVEDTGSQVRWRLTRARLAAREGDREEARRLADEAVGLADQTDCLDQRADALRCVGDVAELCGGPPAEALAAALELYRQKGNTVLADRVRARLGDGETRGGGT